MNQFPICFSRESCPPVFRVYGASNTVERVTLLRAPDEAEWQFAERAQHTAYRMWLRSGCSASCRIECIYDVPTPADDPHFFDDERWMDMACLRGVLSRKGEPAEVHLACVAALLRIHGH